MAYLGQTFNVADHVPSSPDPVPAGWYTAKITDAKVKDTKAGTGNFLEVTFSILGPSYEGRCVWGRFNLKNPNPQAEQIGQSQFMDMARAALRWWTTRTSCSAASSTLKSPSKKGTSSTVTAMT